MVLDGIDVFVKVVQAGGFSAAARQLRMPTSTVSAKIARLEERLGTTLIQRSTRRLHVTDTGRSYFEHCQQALAALEAGESLLTESSGNPHGMLRLTAPSDVAQMLLLPLIERYLERYPGVEVDLVVTNRTLDMLAEGIDLAVRASPMQDSAMTSRKYAEGQLGLWATADYLQRHGTPQTPDDLKHHRIAGLWRMLDRVALSDGHTSFIVALSSRLRCDDMQTLTTAALRGSTITLLPNFGAVQPGNSAELVRVLPQFRSEMASINFIYPAQRYVKANVRAFIDLATGEA